MSPRKFFRGTYLGLLLAFLYSPIVVMIALSFNGSRSRPSGEASPFKWYAELVGDRQILSALQLTLIIAVVATVVATVLGTLAAIGIHAMKKRPAALIMNISYLP